MKKILLLILSSFIICKHYAQPFPGGTQITSPLEADLHYILNLNGTHQWEVGTNNTGNGTSNNQFFIYDDNYRLTIQKGTGFVGIGTKTPRTKLEISGYLSNPSTAGAPSGNFLLNDGSNIGLTMGVMSGANNLFPGWIQVINNTYGMYYPLLLNPNGGNIGIGTTLPNAKLSIKRTAGEASIKAADEGGNGYLILDGLSSGGKAINAVSLNHYIDGHVFLAIGGGNVGVGTASPNAKLSIQRPAGEASIKAADEGGYGYLILDGLSSGNKTSNAVSLNHYIDGHVFLANGGGNVGIGTDNPSNNLTVNGTIGIYGSGLDGTTNQRAVIYSDIANGLYFDAPLKADGTKLPINFGWRGGNAQFSILGNGNVLIGKTSQTNSTYKLDVAGKIRADEIVINTSGADFVFSTTYKLPTLSEVEQFVKTNQHLPEIPSATEMQQQGVSVSEMQVKLLQKVEELTLYMIEREKENNELKKKLIEQDLKYKEILSLIEKLNQK